MPQHNVIVIMLYSDLHKQFNMVLFSQMDGDGTNTDASQLNITGDYMAGGHYVLQTQEGKEFKPDVSFFI